MLCSILAGNGLPDLLYLRFQLLHILALVKLKCSLLIIQPKKVV